MEKMGKIKKQGNSASAQKTVRRKCILKDVLSDNWAPDIGVGKMNEQRSHDIQKNYNN